MKLGFFTSYNCGISLWAKMGTLDREISLYRRLSEFGVEVHLFAGERAKDISEMIVGPEFKGVVVHCLYPDWLIFNRFFALLLMPVFLIAYRRIGRKMDVLKTNQGHAGIHVYWASRLWRRPYISRSGYVLAEQLCNRGAHSIKDYLQAWFERITMNNADVCFVPSQYHVDWIRRHFKCGRLVCMPNNVDTEVFRPSKPESQGGYVVAVGRVVALKRHDMLLRACKVAGLPMMLVGDGPCLTSVKDLADKIGADLRAVGRLNNTRLPKIYGGAVAYVICSEYEGHPKTLVEAMACGCACIGTKSPGIKNQIHDGENGLLVDSDEGAIAEAIKRITNDPALASRLRQGARRCAVNNFSLDVLARRELVIISEIAEGACDG